VGSQPHSHSFHDTLAAPDRDRLTDLIPYGVVLADPDAAAIWANRPWRELSGQVQGEWRGHGWLDVCERPKREVTRNELVSTVRTGANYHVDWDISANGQGRRRVNVRATPDLDRGKLVRIVVSVADVTEERARWDRLLEQATHDALTGLYNRAQFLEFLGHALDRRQRARDGVAAVLYVDVDDLKAVNDKFGHAAGDQLLRDVAGRIKAGVRPSDVVARYGGDEFTILCEDLGQAWEAEAVADRIREAVRGHPPGNLSVSVGIAIVEDPEAEAQSYVARADKAMYETRRANAHGLPVKTSRTSTQGNGGSKDDWYETFGILGLHDRPPLATVDLEGVVADALQAASPPADVVLTLRADPSGSPLTVTAERSRLTCVLVNLLTSAYWHGGPNITVETRKGSAAVTVAVEGDDPGLSSRPEEALLAPSVRGGAPSQPRASGLGLGLALARETVEYFGGHLTHEHVLPHGARFALTLPAADPSRS
jgi:diguanylate cyclase (GGDEF)-like protein